MKKLFLLLACACLMFGACEGFMQLQEDEKVEQEEGKDDEKDDEKDDKDDKDEEIGGSGGNGGGGNSGDDPEPPAPNTLSLDQNIMKFMTNSQSEQYLSFYATNDWTAEVTKGSEWLSVSPMSGNGSDQKLRVKVSVADNLLEESRDGAITFRMENAEDEVLLVTQVADLAPDSQNVKLESVGSKLMALYPAEDYAELSELSKYAEETYFNEKYDWSVFEERYCEVYEDAYLETETMSGFDYEIALMLSQCTGTFTLGTNAATYSASPVDKTILKFRDMDGQQCTATITQVGAVREIYIGHYWDDYYDYEYEQKKTDNFYFTIGLPEQIKAEVVLGSGRYVTVTFDYDINISSSGVNVTTDNVTVKTKVKVSDTEMEIENLHYNAATGKAEFKCTVNKGGRSLLTLSGRGNGKIEIVTETDSDGQRYQYVDVKAISSLAFDLDILGEIQLKGDCADAYNLLKDFDEEHEELGWETNQIAKWSEMVDDLNKGFDIKMYYDKSSIEQATLKLEPDVDMYESYEGLRYDYDVMPVICFSDGSQFSIEEYFSEDAFSSLIGSAEDFVDSYVEMFDL